MATLAQAVASNSSVDGGAEIAVTFGSNVTVGNVIVARARYAQAPASTATITFTDNLGNTYVPIINLPAVPGTDEQAIAFAYAKVTTGGTCTVTASDGTHQRRDIDVFEVAGLDATTPFEASNTSSGSDSTSLTSGNVTTAAGGFILAYVQASGGYSTVTPPSSPWVAVTIPAIWLRAGSVYQLTAAGGTYGATFASSNSDNWAGGIVAFKDGGPSATLDQKSFRFGLDDGAENAHTWAAAENVNITASATATRTLNEVVDVTGEPPAGVVSLQVRLVGETDWINVPVLPD